MTAEEGAMFAITESVTIARPVGEVFAYLGDMEHLMAWAQGVQRVTRTPAGPTQEGTVFACAGKLGGLAMTGTYRIEAFEPATRLVASGVFASMRFVDDWRFAPAGGGTR